MRSNLERLAGVMVMALLWSGCVGGRIGYRTGVQGNPVRGVYGGPMVSCPAVVYPSSMGVWPGLEVGGFFAKNETLVAVSPYLVKVGGGGGAYAQVGFSLAFGRKTRQVQFFGCGGVTSVIFGQVCVRGSSQNWVGADVGAGLNLAYGALVGGGPG